MPRTLLLLVSALALSSIDTSRAEQSVNGVLRSNYDEQIGLLLFDPAYNRLFVVQGKMLSGLSVSGDGEGVEVLFARPLSALALASESDLGMVTFRAADSVSLVDLDTAVVRATLESAVPAPDVALYDGLTRRFFAASSRNTGLAAIETTGGKQKRYDTAVPIRALASNHRGWLFAAASNEPAVYVFDSSSGANLGSFPAPGCLYPSALAVDDVERRLYLACTNGQLQVLDSDNGVVLSRQEISPGPAGLVLRRHGDRALQAIVAVEGQNVSISEGRITADTVRNVLYGLGNGTALQVDSVGSRLFVATGSSVTVLDLQ